MRRYSAEQNQFPIEVALDLDYRRGLWQEARRRAGQDREQALRVVGALIDMNNLMWVIRYRVYHQLSEEERSTLWSKVMDADKRAGGNMLIACNSRWADEEIYDWAVIEYPDMDAYQKKVDELEKLEWWRSVTTKTILGTKMED